MKKLDKLLLKILIASALIFLVSVIFPNKEKNAPKAVQSAILNSKYKSDIAKIEIETPQGQASEREKITLSKHGEFWLFLQNDENGEEICTQADKKIISSLLENSIKIRKMYTISDRISDYDSFSVGDETGTTVRFYKNDGNLCTEVHFGYADSLKNRIYLRSSASKTVWECENDFSQYLTTDSNYWAEGEIFPEIKTPVKIIFESKEKKPQKSLKESVLDEKIRSSMLKSVIEERPAETAQKIVLDEKSPDFAEKSRKLLSLRHGKVRPQSALDTSFLIATLTLEDGSGRISVVDVFGEKIGAETEHSSLAAENVGRDGQSVGEESEAPSTEENSYFYRKRVIPSPADSGETAFALMAENAVYEISSWTWERMREALKL